jgi:hypothetical protein
MKKPVKLKEGKFLEKKKPKKSEVLKGIISSGREKLESLVGANLKDAKTKEGKPSKGQMKRKDGSTYGLMGDQLLKIQGRRDKIEGGLKTAGPAALIGAGVGASSTGKDSDKKKRTQADRKKSRTGRPTAAQQKKIDNAERKAAFDKAFTKARNAGDPDFMFRGKKYTTDIKTDDPGKVSRVVKKANGGMMKKKGYAKGGAARKGKPRGVGAAMRGYGKALR